jgi:DNA-directed RNA polymerase subunit M/transcription elongation factor TFIIS
VESKKLNGMGDGYIDINTSDILYPYWFSSPIQLIGNMTLVAIPQPDTFRQNIRRKLGEMLSAPGAVPGAGAGDDAKTCGNLEKSVYNYTIREATARNIVKKWDNPGFVNLYLDRLRSMYRNLKNPEFAAKVVSGEIAAETVAFMTHYEMNPGRWEESLEKKMMRDASRLNNNVQASTDMYTCKRCKSKKTTYYEVATRSADEQMTIFITCLDCGKNWKQ